MASIFRVKRELRTKSIGTFSDGEREGRRAESYAARFSAPTGKNGASREYRKELHEASWRSLTIGATFRLELGLLGRVRNLDPSPRG
jgi:hypothetical protein